MLGKCRVASRVVLSFIRLVCECLRSTLWVTCDRASVFHVEHMRGGDASAGLQTQLANRRWARDVSLASFYVRLFIITTVIIARISTQADPLSLGNCEMVRG
jgi:hypothetical protein